MFVCYCLAPLYPRRAALYHQPSSVNSGALREKLRRGEQRAERGVRAQKDVVVRFDNPKHRGVVAEVSQHGERLVRHVAIGLCFLPAVKISLAKCTCALHRTTHAQDAHTWHIDHDLNVAVSRLLSCHCHSHCRVRRLGEEEFWQHQACLHRWQLKPRVAQHHALLAVVALAEDAHACKPGGRRLACPARIFARRRRRGDSERQRTGRQKCAPIGAPQRQ